MNFNLFENCSCPYKPLKHTVGCLANHMRITHQQLASAASQIDKSLEAMDHIASAHEKTVADNLFEAHNAVVATSPELSGLETANIMLFVVVVAALNHAQAALHIYLKARKDNLAAAGAAKVLSNTSRHIR
jgi:hypothetical protein